MAKNHKHNPNTSATIPAVATVPSNGDSNPLANVAVLAGTGTGTAPATTPTAAIVAAPVITVEEVPVKVETIIASNLLNNPPPVTPAPEGDVTKAMAKLVADLPDSELKTKMLEKLEKLIQQDLKTTEASRMAAFNAELKPAIGDCITKIAEKYGITLVGRKLVINFPDGKPNYTLATEGKREHSGATREGGFPAGHGKASFIVDGITTEYKSASALAKHLGLQITGKRNMVDVFENPQVLDTKTDLPKIYKAVAGGEKFIVTQTS